MTLSTEQEQAAIELARRIKSHRIYAVSDGDGNYSLPMMQAHQLADTLLSLREALAAKDREIERLTKERDQAEVHRPANGGPPLLLRASV